VSGAGILGVDVSEPVSEKVARCQKAGGVEYGVVRAWHSYGAFDPNALTTLASWKAANISAGVYLFPCATRSPLPQVTEMLGNLTKAGATFNRVWLDVETNDSPGCGYSSNKPDNCKWLQSLVAAVESTGVPVGIYTSIHEYELLLSDTSEGCALGASSVPLWYPHYEIPPQPDFRDFAPFAAWRAPAVKQFGDTYKGSGIPDCGVGIDVNWAPVMPPL